MMGVNDMMGELNIIISYYLRYKRSHLRLKERIIIINL